MWQILLPIGVVVAVEASIGIKKIDIRRRGNERYRQHSKFVAMMIKLLAMKKEEEEEESIVC